MRAALLTIVLVLPLMSGIMSVAFTDEARVSYATKVAYR